MNVATRGEKVVCNWKCDIEKAGQAELMICPGVQTLTYSAPWWQQTSPVLSCFISFFLLFSFFCLFVSNLRLQHFWFLLILITKDLRLIVFHIILDGERPYVHVFILWRLKVTKVPKELVPRVRSAPWYLAEHNWVDGFRLFLGTSLTNSILNTDSQYTVSQTMMELNHIMRYRHFYCSYTSMQLLYWWPNLTYSRISVQKGKRCSVVTEFLFSV